MSGRSLHTEPYPHASAISDLQRRLHAMENSLPQSKVLIADSAVSISAGPGYAASAGSGGIITGTTTEPSAPNQYTLIPEASLDFEIFRPAIIEFSSHINFWAEDDDAAGHAETPSNHALLRHVVSASDPGDFLPSLHTDFLIGTQVLASHDKWSDDVLPAGAYTAQIQFFVDNTQYTKVHIWEGRLKIYMVT